VKPPPPRLHAITDERIARRADLGAVARQLGAAGGDQLAFHARGRALSGLEHYELSVRLSACPPVRLFVNDRLDIALAAGADGVQLRRDSLGPADARRLNPAWLIGVSVHDLTQARAACAQRPDYLLAGPVFATATKPDSGEPLGLERLAGIALAVDIPVVAIGGITIDNVAQVFQAGAAGAAVVSAVVSAEDITAAARALKRRIAEARGSARVAGSHPRETR